MAYKISVVDTYTLGGRGTQACPCGGTTVTLRVFSLGVFWVGLWSGLCPLGQP